MVTITPPPIYKQTQQVRYCVPMRNDTILEEVTDALRSALNAAMIKNNLQLTLVKPINTVADLEDLPDGSVVLGDYEQHDGTIEHLVAQSSQLGWHWKMAPYACTSQEIMNDLKNLVVIYLGKS